MKIHIVPGNSKLGNTPNISTVPGKDCGKGVPCTKDCYARKFYRQYPNVRKAWNENSRYQRVDPTGYFGDIYAWLMLHRPKYFRIHVAGDFISQNTVHRWGQLGSGIPATRFLAYTKREDLFFGYLPENFIIRHSMWPGWGNAKLKLPKFWMQDKQGTETRIPKKKFLCPGDCEKCRACWSKDVHDVVVMKH